MKIWKKFIVLGFVFGLLLIGSTVCAETLPVKNAWILDEDCVVVLREDGNLLIANSIDAETPESVFENVSDFYGNVHNGYMSGVVLFKNGDVATIGYNNEITIVANNAKEIYSLPFFQYAYIDNNNVLRGKHSYVNTDNTAIMKNVKKCYDDSFYLITNDDILYELDIEDNSKNEIMTNVKDIKLANNDLLILRNNGDLYLYKGPEIPNRIGTNIENLSKVVFRDTWVDHYEIEYVNKNGEYFVGSATSDFKKYLDHVKDVYRYEDNKYALTNDNILYRNPSLNDKNPSKTYNVQKMLGETDYFVLKTDNKVYANRNYRLSYIFIDNVRDVIVYEGSVGVEDDRYFFIKNDGTLYGAFGKEAFLPNTPFLTSFCQKQTKVLINQQEIELTAKIQMVDNRSMYPFRECLENMGATVMWDSVNEIAIGEYGETTIEFPIGKKEYYINGTRYEMDTASYVDESIGRTYIPIRYAAEGLGFTVDWIEGDSENTISIHK